MNWLRKALRQVDIARRERITGARVTQMLSLLELADDLKAMLLEGHDDVADWSIHRALRAVADGR